MKSQGLLAIFMLLALGSIAQAANPPAFGKHNSKQPIEINADSLDVMQTDQKAIFTGNVIVTQGEVTLRSDKMTVFYKNSGAKPAADSAVPGGGAISRILVNGHVKLTTREESASGNNGIYDVEKNTIQLMDNVTLTKGKNVLKGAKLDYDLTTGKSRVNSVGGQIGEKTQNGRVRAVFIPGQGQ